MLDINNRQSKPNAKHVLGVQEFHFFFFLEPPSGGFFENPPQENFPKAHGIFGWHDCCQKFKGTTIFLSLSLFLFYLHTLSMFVFCLHSLSLSRWSQKYSFDTISAGSWVERQLWGICCKNFYFLPNLASEGGRGGHLIPFIIIMYIKAIKNSKSFFQKYKKRSISQKHKFPTHLMEAG